MSGPRVAPDYAQEAASASAAAMEHLAADGKRCLVEAEKQSRHLDDNHVGTEHIVLGVLAADPEVASILARNGVTEELFQAQLFEEPEQPGGTRLVALPGGSRHVGGNDVGGMPVQGSPGPVISHRGPRVGVGRGFLHIPKRHTRVLPVGGTTVGPCSHLVPERGGDYAATVRKVVKLRTRGDRQQ